MLWTVAILTLDLGLFLFVGFKGASIFGYHFDGDQRKVGQGAALMLGGSCRSLPMYHCSRVAMCYKQIATPRALASANSIMGISKVDNGCKITPKPYVSHFTTFRVA